jgi:hydroxymethylbilane synthase
MIETGVVRIGTRQSALALMQARLVQAELAARGVRGELVTFTTVGDVNLAQPLSEIGGKGLFTKELEVALASGAIDCAVHSLKDLPTESPPGLVIAATLRREDPRDALVVGPTVAARSLSELPRGARVGTSSLRRRAQVAAVRPDLEIVELRGNVPTRVRKVDDGVVSAAVLAAAGLHRLGASGRIAAYLDAPGWLPAAGQGAIAVQVRVDDAAAVASMKGLDDAETHLMVDAERAFLAALQGGCQVPIGALVVGDGAGGYVLHGLIASVDGRSIVRAAEPVAPGDPVRAGVALADRLLRDGGDSILRVVREAVSVPAPQPE